MERRVDLDRGKVFAILLVVFGHLVARTDPVGVDWYEPVRALLYAFHIPFLFYLSGYAAQLSGATDAVGESYRLLLRRRMHRLLLPALAFGLVIMLGKLAAHPFIHVDHTPLSLGQGLADLVWHTDRSPAQSVWYLIVLFVFAAATPPLLALLHGSRAGVLALGCLLFVAPVPPILYADRLATNFLFFVAGVLAARADRAWIPWIDARWRSLGMIFGAALLVAFLLGDAMPLKARLLLVSVAALPALHAAIRRLPPAVTALLDRIAPYAFAIYLLNTIFIGLAKGLMMMVLPWSATWFPVFVVILLGAGTAGPILAMHGFVRLFRPYRRVAPAGLSSKPGLHVLK